MIPTTVEFMAALEHTDATFRSSMPLATLLKPTLFLMLFASLVLSSRLGHDHPFDTLLLSTCPL